MIRYHGGQPISSVFKSAQSPASRQPRWDQWVTVDLTAAQLPRVRSKGKERKRKEKEFTNDWSFLLSFLCHFCCLLLFLCQFVSILFQFCVDFWNDFFVVFCAFLCHLCQFDVILCHFSCHFFSLFPLFPPLLPLFPPFLGRPTVPDRVRPLERQKKHVLRPRH